MLTVLVAFAVAAADSASEQADVAAAKSWVSLVDARRWNESWNAAGTLFKSRMPKMHWASAISPVRLPLGAVLSRAVKSIEPRRSLPGAPDGDYEVVQFQTSFVNKAAALETVVLAREPSGWKVDGDFIR